jgi:hypothetical protein
MIRQTAGRGLLSLDAVSAQAGQAWKPAVSNEIVPVTVRQLARVGLDAIPVIIRDPGEKAGRRFIEFFTANIRNKNTRLAYAHAVSHFLNGQTAEASGWKPSSRRMSRRTSNNSPASDHRRP